MSGSDKDDDVLAPTSDERALAEARRDAVDDGLDPLAELLVASVRPRDLDAALHEQILARALGSEAEEADESEPTAAEKKGAELLRQALDGGADAGAVGPLVALVRVLRATYRPTPLDQLSAERILRPALATPGRRTQRVTLVVAVTTAVAIAAAAAGLFFRAPPAPVDGSSASAQLLPGMVEARSTTELFGQEDFPAVGGTTERIDRIQSSRESDLRNNRFVAWGVP